MYKAQHLWVAVATILLLLIVVFATSSIPVVPLVVAHAASTSFAALIAIWMAISTRPVPFRLLLGTLGYVILGVVSVLQINESGTIFWWFDRFIDYEASWALMSALIAVSLIIDRQIGRPSAGTRAHRKFQFTLATFFCGMAATAAALAFVLIFRQLSVHTSYPILVSDCAEQLVSATAAISVVWLIFGQGSRLTRILVALPLIIGAPMLNSLLLGYDLITWNHNLTSLICAAFLVFPLLLLKCGVVPRDLVT